MRTSDFIHRLKTGTPIDPRERFDELFEEIEIEEGEDLPLIETLIWRIILNSDLSAARNLHDILLLGWWVTVGHCSRSGHASIGPDYNDPERGEDLKRRWPEERWHAGIDVDIEDGEGWNRACRAWLAAMLEARSTA